MEALILYFVLFFPGIYAASSPDWLVQGAEAIRTVPFSIIRELGRTLTYTLPAMALLLYIISEKKDLSALKAATPQKRDLLPFAAGLPGLIIIGLFVSLLVSLFSGLASPARVQGPSGFFAWSVMIFACLGTGYLEETYFRYYLLTKLEKIIPYLPLRIAFSTVLFALCHMHEGPWGVLNAALAGVFLSVLFIRYRSLHGIAFAHAGYNIFVYAIGNLV